MRTEAENQGAEVHGTIWVIESLVEKNLIEKTKGIHLLETLKQVNFSLPFDARLESVASGDEFYDGHIFRNVTTFQFTRKLFIRGIGEYNTFDNSFNIYPLVSYKFNAFTMFCAGMTRNYLEYDLEDSIIYRTTGRQYFVKLQYLFTL